MSDLRQRRAWHGLRWRKLTSYLVPICLWGLVSQATAEESDLGRQVRSILSDKCFLCHGPDEGNRQADLRLDVRAAAISAGAVAPGDVAGSQMWQRINETDAELVMPPPETGKTLTQRERELLRQWIAQGAEALEHWAFVPPVRPRLPEVRDAARVRNPIDRFVLARLESLNLGFAPDADAATLTRRLYLDLLGLPPQPKELEECAQSLSAGGEEGVLTRLFSSPHFGEKWARWWLDAARYADSDGYEKDKQRSVWFYRDWVINAMNTDMPYDQFVIEQIAGDVIDGATQSQRVATGFLRNSMVNEEGGADPEQFRVEAMFDRLDAIGKAILGVTTQCAQCHTHKYDPLTQAEYYQMFAALNDFHEATISVFTPRQAAQRDSVLARIAEREQVVKQQIPDWSSRLAAWEQAARDQLVRWQTMTPTDVPYAGQKFRILEDGSILSESYAPTRTTDSFKLVTRLDRITAVRLDALLHPQLPRGGPGRSIYGTGAVTEFEVTVRRLAAADPPRRIKFTRAYSDANPPRAELLAAFRDRDPENDDRVTGPIEYAIDGDAKTAWSTDVGAGRRQHPRVAVFIPEEPLVDLGDVELVFTLKQNHGGWNSDDNQNYLLGRYRFSVTDDPRATHADWLPSEVETSLLKAATQRTPAEQEVLFSHWRSTLSELHETNAAIEALWQEFPETDSQLVVAARDAGPRPTYVYTRGDFLKPGESVSPGVPEFLGAQAFAAGEPPRLQFAHWLVRRDAPTTARVIVNRLWQAYFGRGLVATPEDFGSQSVAPSHPELLDWLAVELMEHQWSLKHIHRLIVTSSTYRQQARVTAELAERDPFNVWLARGPRVRVEAEVVRDIALTISGLLDDTVGGPSVYPPAPEFLFQPPASYGPKIWKPEESRQSYRRSLYVHSYRSVPYPPLQVFDAPKGDAACVRRERSNTPLQALVLLNEPQFFEWARAMAARVLRESGPSDRERLVYAHRLAVGRRPEPGELAILQQLLAAQQQRIAAGDLDVEALLVGSNATTAAAEDEPTSPAGLAAWVVVTRALLNLDETITKQ